MLATNVVGGFGNRQRRVGEGHIWGGSDSGKPFLQFYFKKVQNPRISAGLRTLGAPTKGLPQGDQQVPFRPDRPRKPRFTGFSRPGKAGIAASRIPIIVAEI